jgi:hypothetical protein
MANIVAYSSGYLRNPSANQPGKYQVATSGTLVPIYEPKFPWPEKCGDGPVATVTLAIPFYKLDLATKVAIGDLMYVCPLPQGAKVIGCQVDITTGAAGGSVTANLGNATSATAYLTGLDLTSVAVTAPTQAVLDAAAVGASNTDAVFFTLAAATTPTGAGVATITVTLSVPG